MANITPAQTVAKYANEMVAEKQAEVERLRAAARAACSWLLLPGNQDLPGSDAVYRGLDEAINRHS